MELKKYLECPSDGLKNFANKGGVSECVTLAFKNCFLSLDERFLKEKA
jgi:hypothetical protein